MLLWNTYAALATGISMRVLNCREYKRGVKKRAGFSHALIQVNNEVHTTLAIGDQHHPQMILYSCHFPFLNQNAIIPRKETSRGIALGCVNKRIIIPILYTNVLLMLTRENTLVIIKQSWVRAPTKSHLCS
jgi:hypothetical protein